MCYFRRMKKSAWLALAVALAACGGKIDGDDGGTTSDGGGGLDAVAKKDAPATIDVGPPQPTCSPIEGSASGGPNGECETTASWSCGDTKYTVDCSCPSTQCTCSELGPNGSGGGTIMKEPSICPSCSGDLPAICGFPH